MPTLNWDVFVGLPGAVQANFESLCRSLVRRNYGKYGHFGELAAQPGVEFHLKLERTCSLGEPGQWYGWQCRWYDLPSGRALGTTRRRKIEEAIRKTEALLPALTDWVLWTRHPLTRGDQGWFSRLKTKGMHLHLWTAKDVESHLSGESAILRSTYFGELVLTPRDLAKLHECATAPIRSRWLPEAHQRVKAEHAIRKMLGQAVAWSELWDLTKPLLEGADAVAREAKALPKPLKMPARLLVTVARSISATIKEMHAASGSGDFALLRQQITACSAAIPSEAVSLPRNLRRIRHRAVFRVTNLLADVRTAVAILCEVRACTSTRVVAVVADAGCGKTHLAAQLTAPEPDRPAGFLLHGKDLHAGGSLDDLARRVVVHSTAVGTMEALIAAVEAAAERAGRRLPIVIDGLNEAEDARDWKHLLAGLQVQLAEHPHVLVVCTLRTTFVEWALPAGFPQLKITGFADDTWEAVRRYFDYYKINGADVRLPIRLLAHPLTLRLFCEVTNPDRQKVVGVEAMPSSLTALFDRFIASAIDRIVQLAPSTCRYYATEVKAALGQIGFMLWEAAKRSLDEAVVRKAIGDEGRRWDESMLRAMEQEGVLIRDAGAGRTSSQVTAVYDLLGGHIAADAIIARSTGIDPTHVFSTPSTISLLGGEPPEGHALASDIRRALAGLMPRRLYGQHLWPLLPEPLRHAALSDAADLEGTYLDRPTVDALAEMVGQSDERADRVLNRLWQTRATAIHPLNSCFLDRLLRPMEVAERDLRWSEWVRRNTDGMVADLQRWADRWQKRRETRSTADRLRARWMMWTLTSTVRALRDKATLALYWFGRGDPPALMDLAIESLDVNDLFVPQRMLAACYGVAMAAQVPDDKVAAGLKTFLAQLSVSLLGSAATHPTSDWLSRLYVRGMFDFARMHYSQSVPEAEPEDFAEAKAAEPIFGDDERSKQMESILYMDFENYTVGRLCPGRAPYDADHPSYTAAMGHIRGTVWSLGWRAEKFAQIERTFPTPEYRHDRAGAERYGQKYRWIGYYTYAGAVEGRTSAGRSSELQIDPSFPMSPPPSPLPAPILVRPTPAKEPEWLRKGAVAIPDHVWYQPALGAHVGPWLLADGHLSTARGTGPRRVFGFLRTLLVASQDAECLIDALASREYPGNQWLPEAPEDYYTFAGEIPWSPQFALGYSDVSGEDPYKGVVQMGRALDDGIEVEVLSHRYGWESYHSELNRAGHPLVPSRAFAQTMGLRGLPQTFDQVDQTGRHAAISLAAPTGLDGYLLYLREDLLHKYAKGRRLIWYAWGERQLEPFPHPTPDWLVQILRKHEMMWRVLRRGEALSRRFAGRGKAGRC